MVRPMYFPPYTNRLKIWLGKQVERKTTSANYLNIKSCVFFCFFSWLLVSNLSFATPNSPIVTKTKQIILEEYPNAYNPSIIEFGDDILMTFRFTPSPNTYPWISYIGVVLLDKDFTPISRPQLLNTCFAHRKTLSQTEDPRLFRYKNRIFLIYNDNLEKTHPTHHDRRDMFFAELLFDKKRFSLSFPQQLIYEEKYPWVFWQKNWMPFEYNDMLFFIYSINPHEILFFNFLSAKCYLYDRTENHLQWDWGQLRGSTPPLLDEGEYICFFHSSIPTTSAASYNYEMWHYFMGAYTFSNHPPFQIKKISDSPILHYSFYTPSSYYKRVIFPGGCIISGSTIYLAYGKDDSEIWIASLDKKALKASLKEIKSLPSTAD